MDIRTLLSALASGLVFGLGLAVSGMIDPGRVLGFLDIGALFGPGVWDPTLAFVMGGALAVTIPAFARLRQTAHPLFAARFQWPTRADIDPRLVAGSGIFGIGWGLVGLCPGPAISALSSGLWPVLLFVAAMLAGMLIFRVTMAR